MIIFNKKDFLCAYFLPLYTLKHFNPLHKTHLGEIACLNNLYYLLAAQAASFLIHSPFLNRFSYDNFDTLPLTAQYLCDLRGHLIIMQVIKKVFIVFSSEEILLDSFSLFWRQNICFFNINITKRQSFFTHFHTW